MFLLLSMRSAVLVRIFWPKRVSSASVKQTTLAQARLIYFELVVRRTPWSFFLHPAACYASSDYSPSLPVTLFLCPIQCVQVPGLLTTSGSLVVG
jgi:hypothetical protein